MKRCLEKDAKQRIRDIGDVRLALEGAFETTAAAPRDGVARHDRSTWNPLSVALASLLLLVAGIAGWALVQPEPPRPVVRFESPFRAGQAPIGPLEMTSDGSAVVYVGPGESIGSSQLWIRRWDELDARPIPGTEGARAIRDLGQLALSPDGREVAFVVGNPGPLRLVPLLGGTGRTLAETAYAVAWSQDDWLYFIGRREFNISRIRPVGGEPETVTTVAEGEGFHIFPQPLPNGKALLFQVLRSGDGTDAEIWSVDLQTHVRNRLTLGSSARYSPSGHLLFGTTAGTLMAAPFDVERAALSGPAVPIAEGLYTTEARRNLVYKCPRTAPFCTLPATVRHRLPSSFGSRDPVKRRRSVQRKVSSPPRGTSEVGGCHRMAVESLSGESSTATATSGSKRCPTARCRA